jgi:acyl carrier protein
MASGECVEVLGVKDNSPITEHVLKGGGSYHTCFIVEDIDFAIKQAISGGAILVVEPREDDVFLPRRVCFMMHSNHGLFEFLESFPKRAKVESIQKKKNTNINKVKEVNVRNIASSSKIIIQAFNSTFSNIMNEEDILNATYEEIEVWDSLKHLMLIMEIEKLSGTTFTAIELSEAKSFLDINNILIKKISKL